MNEPAEAPRTRRRVRLGAVLAIAIAVGVGAWLVLKDGDDSSEQAAAGPSAATLEDLRALTTEVGHPVYWAGSRAGSRYELTRTANGNIYIRYLPLTAALGAPRPDYLTVGTYPFRRAVPTLRRLARRQRAVSVRLEGGGFAVASGRRALNAYLAYPGADVQVEVFHPTPGRALQLVRSGRVVPLG
jgi:hypothetical protein